MLEFCQHIVNGLSLGSIYALIALGYTMVFGILQLINFAHSDVYMLGAFIGLYSARYLHLGQTSSLPALVMVLGIAMVGCGLAGFIIERFAYRPLRKSPRINVLITAVGGIAFPGILGATRFWIRSQVLSANLCSPGKLDHRRLADQSPSSGRVFDFGHLDGDSSIHYL